MIEQKNQQAFSNKHIYSALGLWVAKSKETFLITHSYALTSDLCIVYLYHEFVLNVSEAATMRRDHLCSIKTCVCTVIFIIHDFYTYI